MKMSTLNFLRQMVLLGKTTSGSASLKSVLPALTRKGYEGMDIADGGTASREYARVTFGDAGEEERQKVRKHLVEYCGLDTEGMIWIVEELTKIIS